MRLSALAFVLAAGLSVSTVRASVIAYDNFGAGDSYDAGNQWSVEDGYQAIAVPFVSAATGDLQSYTVAVYGNKAFTLQLFQDNGGVPGTVLETLVTPKPASSNYLSSEIMTVASVGQPHLVTGNTYWVGLLPATNSAGGWMWNSEGELGMAAKRFAPTEPWISYLYNPLYPQSALRVEVPEPAAVGVFAVSILGLLNHRWRKA